MQQIQAGNLHTDKKQEKYSPTTSLPMTLNSRLQNPTHLVNGKVVLESSDNDSDKIQGASKLNI
jgi:hypothetical protein